MCTTHFTKIGRSTCLGIKVDISDRQAMARSYHSLDADQVQVLKSLNENDSTAIENPITSRRRKIQKKRGKQSDTEGMFSHPCTFSIKVNMNLLQTRQEKDE